MEFKLVLKEEEIRLLGQAVMELPTKFGMPLIEKIQRQVNEQIPHTTSGPEEKPSQERSKFEEPEKVNEDYSPKFKQEVEETV